MVEVVVEKEDSKCKKMEFLNVWWRWRVWSKKPKSGLTAKCFGLESLMVGA